MNRLLVTMALAALAPGCSDLPMDPEGTLERIARERLLRVGVVASGPAATAADRQQALIARIAAATGSRPSLLTGSAEPLLMRLEQGELDLVVGEFHATSPWMLHVHILPPIAASSAGEEETIVAAAARNGENRWIMLLDREARALAQPE